jgi:hypothetical protein
MIGAVSAGSRPTLQSAEAAEGPRIETAATDARIVSMSVLDSDGASVIETGPPLHPVGWAEMSDEERTLRQDPRVRAFVRAYDALIDSVTYRDGDIVFALGNASIHFEDGRMLDSRRLARRNRCDPLFYEYTLGPLTEPPPYSEEKVTYCNDVQEALWGRTERQIRTHAHSTEFLDRKVFLNDLVIEALAAVEADILAAAEADADVAAWVDGVDIAYSLQDRSVAGTAIRSQHAFGLAVDLVPRTYNGLNAYWRWSRVYHRTSWHRIPVEKRWTPPEAVVQIFEGHGFVWGGKWTHFDNIHFEYRPEILEYNRLVAAAMPLQSSAAELP